MTRWPTLLLAVFFVACSGSSDGTASGDEAASGDPTSAGDTNVPGDTRVGGDPVGGDVSASSSLYLPETPDFDLDVAEAAINAQRAGRGTAARPNPPAQPQGSLTPVNAATEQEVAAAIAQGSVDITLTADMGLLRFDTAQDVLLRLNGHVVDVSALTHFQDPTAARRVKVLGPGGIGDLPATDFVGGVPEDITFEGVWFSRALKSTPDDGVSVNLSGRRVAFLYCVGRGHDSADRGAWALITGDPANVEDIVIYGSNISADPNFTNDGDNWGTRAGHVSRYWIVDTRIQADSWRQANRIYRLHDSVPGYTTPANKDTPRHATFVNVHHGHAYASIGAAGTNYNLGVFSKDIILVSAQRGASAPGVTLFGPNLAYDEGTWVWEGVDVITDAGTIDATSIANVEAAADVDEDIDLDFTDNGEANTYVADPTLVDPYANNTNWPAVVSPNVGLVGSNPHEPPPWL